MNRRKRLLHNTLWVAIALTILFGVSQILADPTQPASSHNPILINEIYLAEETANSAERATTFDWIELVNTSEQTIDLVGWTLTDDLLRPNKIRLPDTRLEGGEHILLIPEQADVNGGELPWRAITLNFNLNPTGGTLALYPPTSRRFLDTAPLIYPQQLAGHSFGRYVDETGEGYGHLNAPTPATANNTGVAWRGTTPSVTFSTERGFYDQPLEIALDVATSDAKIHYTTDGSTPTDTHGTLYGQPILVDSTTTLRAVAFQTDNFPSPVQTHSYIFIDDVMAQPADPPGWPDTWGQHKISFGGYQEGTPVEADYAMDREVVQDAADLRTGLRSIPSISLVTDQSNLDIYADPQARGAEAERPVSVEFLPSEAHAGFASDMVGGIATSDAIQQDAGLRIQGGAGRWEFMPKHSFRLFFKRQYGDGKLRTRVFANSPVAEFDTLVLRAGVDRAFPGHPPAPGEEVDHRQTTYARDEWVRQSQLAMSGMGVHGTFVHLYLNGLYWGLYNVTERPDTSFMAAYFGGERDDYYTANHGGPVEGQTDRFDVLLRLAEEGGLADPERYATMLEFVDPIQFSDYVLLNWYAGNRDWPMNNWYISVGYPAGRNLFFVWDAEDTWNSGAEVNLESKTFGTEPFPNVTKLVFDALMENAEFRLLFADRANKHLHDGGALTDAASQARWSAITDGLETAIIAESARWGDVRYEEPITQADWQNARDDVLAQMAGNGARLIEQMRERGFYPAVDPPEFNFDISEQSDSSVDEIFEEDASSPTSANSPPHALARGGRGLLSKHGEICHSEPAHPKNGTSKSGIGPIYSGRSVECEESPRSDQEILRISRPEPCKHCSSSLQMARMGAPWLRMTSVGPLFLTAHAPAPPLWAKPSPTSVRGPITEGQSTTSCCQSIPPDGGMLAAQTAAYPVPNEGGLIHNTPTVTLNEPTELRMNATTGQIVYTLDGTDPRDSASDVAASSAILYDAPIAINDATVVKARVFDDTSGAWSALREVTFHRPGQGADVRIGEIMYNPPGGEANEFVEIANFGALEADLSNAYFEGIDFRFPLHATLGPGEVFTLISNFGKFRERYAEAEINGVYGGQLADRGETITLRDFRGNVLSSVTYDDENGWPLSADGAGDSLLLVDRDGDPNNPQSWRASGVLYGSPGEY